MSPPLTIIANGMTTAVGFTASASCAAIRARLDGFRETHFMARGGDRIIGAEVPLEKPWRGIARLARLLARAIGDCLSDCRDIQPDAIPVLLCLAEENRPGRLDGLGNSLFFETCNVLDVRFHEMSRLFPHGRVAGASALHEANRLVHEEGFAHVIGAGVDSYLVTATLDFLGEHNRLLTSANSNGLIPGEAGGAVLVSATGDGLAVRGLGFGIEKATIEREEPPRADGLCGAFRQALASAGLTMADIDYRVSTMSGEQYWFKEAALAQVRLMRERRAEQDLWHPADSIGETGAASLPCCLAVASMAVRKRYAAGDIVLLSACNDDGRRAALVLTPSRPE